MAKPAGRCPAPAWPPGPDSLAQQAHVVGQRQHVSHSPGLPPAARQAFTSRKVARTRLRPPAPPSPRECRCGRCGTSRHAGFGVSSKGPRPGIRPGHPRRTAAASTLRAVELGEGPAAGSRCGRLPCRPRAAPHRSHRAREFARRPLGHPVEAAQAIPSGRSGDQPRRLRVLTRSAGDTGGTRCRRTAVTKGRPAPVPPRARRETPPADPPTAPGRAQVPRPAAQVVERARAEQARAVDIEVLPVGQSVGQRRHPQAVPRRASGADRHAGAWRHGQACRRRSVTRLIWCRHVGAQLPG